MWFQKKLETGDLVLECQKYCMENNQDFSLDDITHIIQAESTSLLGWIRMNHSYSYALRESNERYLDPKIKREALHSFSGALKFLLGSVVAATAFFTNAIGGIIIVNLILLPVLFIIFANCMSTSCSFFANCCRLLIQNYILPVPIDTLQNFGTDALIVMENGIFHVKYYKHAFGYMESYNTNFFSRDQILEAGLKNVGTCLARYTWLVLGNNSTENNEPEVNLGIFDETKVAQILEQFAANSQV